MTLKALYIDRPHLHTHSALNRLAHHALGFCSGQAGFFRFALQHVCAVETVHLDRLLGQPAHDFGQYDAVIFSAKSGILDLAAEDLEKLLSLATARRAILVPGAQPKVMIPDALADRFDVIFKREPWTDLDRYDLSASNKAKICPTLISNPQDPLFARLPNLRVGHRPRRFGYESTKEHDVFFLGRVGKNRYDNRVNMWRRVRELSGILPVGGIIPDKRETHVPEGLEAPPIPVRAYRKTLLRSRINLAPDGLGPFTFRHLELFWSGSFCLSEADLGQIWLRVPAINGQDYVAFSDHDDMAEKIVHFLDVPAELDRIARNGRRFYERLYDPRAHGAEIRKALGL